MQYPVNDKRGEKLADIQAEMGNYTIFFYTLTFLRINKPVVSLIDKEKNCLYGFCSSPILPHEL